MPRNPLVAGQVAARLQMPLVIAGVGAVLVFIPQIALLGIVSAPALGLIWRGIVGRGPDGRLADRVIIFARI